jgi:branched-chain amino acid transport system ATP-binding protein
VTKKFGGLNAVSDVSLEVEQGTVIGLIGPNGAGKTTLFNCINGTLPITEGKIVFNGTDITHKKSHEVAKLGIARSYQIVQPFGNMTRCRTPWSADSAKPRLIARPRKSL